MAGRNWGPGAERRRTSAANWALPARWNKQAKRKGKRLRVFTASLSDWLDNAVPIEWLADLLQQVKENDALDWLMLSKRIGIWRSRLSDCSEVASTEVGRAKWPGLGEWIDAWLAGNAPANVFLGATVVNQTEADRDIPKLLQVPARVRFLSMEPLLGPVDLTSLKAQCAPWFPRDVRLNALSGSCYGRMSEATPSPTRLDWVIVGGESGPGARPMHPDWVRSLRDQCQAASVSFLFKQWGEYAPGTEGFARNGDVVHEHGVWSVRVGKKAAGRLLDGVLHDAVPA